MDTARAPRAADVRNLIWIWFKRKIRESRASSWREHLSQSHGFDCEQYTADQQRNASTTRRRRSTGDAAITRPSDIGSLFLRRAQHFNNGTRAG